MPKKKPVDIHDLVFDLHRYPNSRKANKLFAQLDPEVRREVARQVRRLQGNDKRRATMEKKAAERAAAVAVLEKEFVAWFEEQGGVVTYEQIEAWERSDELRTKAAGRIKWQRVEWLRYERVYVLLPAPEEQARHIYERRKPINRTSNRLKLVS